MKFKISLFIFRRDLRLEDNSGLIFALKSSEKVIPAFIFTPEQIDQNPLKNDHCIRFMIESLQDLEDQLHKKGGNLYLFMGKVEEVVSKLILKLNFEALVVNRDYTPYSIERDKKLEKICKNNNISFHSFDDALLHRPEECLKKNGDPYLIFTPYFSNTSKEVVLPPSKNSKCNYFKEKISFSIKMPPVQKIKTSLAGGRKESLKILKNISSFKDYEKLRDFPSRDYSTHLSPYMKFTTCSPREVYNAICSNLGHNHALIRSLYWRDFFTSIAFFFPKVFGNAFHQNFDKIKWNYEEKIFQRWCEGSTGFPIVDAGMRELNETGFMHNRVRMITASFLIKDLHIDWRLGESYFAKKLIDYDPAVNNGNWQWSASTGCDAQPYFRIFNPWRQQKKFDPECLYIKKWIPELIKLNPDLIHAWEEKKTNMQYPKYPAPIVEHEKQAKKSLSSYKTFATTKEK